LSMGRPSLVGDGKQKGDFRQSAESGQGRVDGKTAAAAVFSRTFETASPDGPIADSPSTRRRCTSASSDHCPAPSIVRNRHVRSCAYSERISCSTAQTPMTGGDGGGGNGDVPRYRPTFVDVIATSISMTNTIAVNRVISPASNRRPPTISTQATNPAVSSGAAKPSLVNRPTP